MVNEGDLAWIDFSPVRGSEQGGWRPSIVLTDEAFHTVRSTAIVCPITRNMDPWPTKYPLPQGLVVSGAVLCEQIRLVSRDERGFKRISSAPRPVLEGVRRILGDLLHIQS
ncbi:MAG: type II toxin-antitoxin system PemK/MazF family toxin [Pseudomonadota bacterium]